MSKTFDFTAERVVFKASDSAFAVLMGHDSEGRPQTLCGPLSQVAEGERMTVVATASDHPRFGPRWEVESVTLKEPDDRPSRIAFLCSIDGIGRSRAEALDDMFGDSTFKEIDRQPEATFLSLPKVGKATAMKAAVSWKERRHVREVMRLLGESGIKETQAIASRAVDEWGSIALETLNDDPYCLVELPGVGFLDADRLAKHLGVADTSSRRIQAAALHLLREAHGAKGHMYLPGGELTLQLAQLLGLSTEQLDVDIDLVAAPKIRCENDRYYTSSAYRAETNLAADIWLMAESASTREPIAEDDLDPTLTEDQKRAVAACWTQRLVMISGPPGVGKTTIIRAITDTAKAQGLLTSLTAPTGRAASRMTQLSGKPASTVHRLLGILGRGIAPEYNAGNPLPADIVICDEASMLDVELAAKLTDALKPDAHLVLVGDADQLPPPGAGDALAELLASPAISHHRLTQVFRQAARSTLLKAAASIRVGQVPNFETLPEDAADLGTFWSADEGALSARAIQAARIELPEKLGISPDDVQVIAPMYRGDAGIDALNAGLRELANPNGLAVMGGRLREGDRLIQTKTDYTLISESGEPFVNGAFCTFDFFNPAEGGNDPFLSVTCEDGSKLEIPSSRTASLKLGYAISAHKSQGSEWPATVVVLPPASTNQFLTRRLLRTALTRARTYCYLVADPATFSAAVGRADQSVRHCAVMERIEQSLDLAIERERETVLAELA